MIPLPIASKLLAGALVAAVAWGAAGEWRVRGLRAEVSELRAAAAQAERDAAVRAEGQGRRAAAAQAEYEAWRAAKEKSHAEAPATLRRELAGPPAGCPGRIGDVLVPAAAVGVLRAAAGDAPGPAPATSGLAGR